MNQPIKFRAWNISTNAWEYYTLDDLYQHKTPKNGLANWCEFTRLFDKNNGEIYEGDVLGYKKEKAPYEVTWSPSKGRWEWGSFPFSATALSSLEVIGNVYENEDLLKV